MKLSLTTLVLAVYWLTASGQSLNQDPVNVPFPHRSAIISPNPSHLSNPSLNELISLAQKQHYYSWEDSTWQEMIYSEYSYGLDDLCDTLINFRETGGDTINRVIYTYYLSGKLKSLKVEAYSGGWVNTSFTSYEYDQHGNQVERSFYVWLGPSMQLASGIKNEYVFDQQSRILELKTVKYNVVSGSWADSSKQVYSYSLSDLPESVTWKKHTAEGWVNESRLVEINWKEFEHPHASGEYLSYERQVWEGEGWANESRRNYNHGEHGSYSYTEEIYFGDQWTNKSRYHLLNTAAGLPGEEYLEEWQDAQWIKTGGSSWIYQFSGIDLEEVIEQLWVADSGYLNDTKITYEDFIHYQHVEEAGELNRLTICPNPFSDHLKIDMPNNGGGQLVINDLNGRLLWIAAVKRGSNRYQVSTGSWPAGIYMLTWIDNEGRILSEKLIKSIR